MKLKLDDKLFCKKTINNILGWPLFEKGETYTVLGIDELGIILDHNLYGCEYQALDIKSVNKNFKKI